MYTMKYLNLLLSALLGLLLVQAAPTSEIVKTIQGSDGTTYDVVDLEWNLNINNSLTVTVTGTVQDVFNRLSELNPAAATAIQETIDGSPTSALTQRDDDDPYNATNFFCSVNGWSDADCFHIGEGIDYLRLLDGTPGNGPGPGNCGRVSCSYNSAIYWCNDNNVSYVLGSYSRIADGASDVMNHCAFEQIQGKCSGGFNGQQFFSGDFNVIVREDSC